MRKKCINKKKEERIQKYNIRESVKEKKEREINPKEKKIR